ncbi:Hypothetical predicted protein [Pelobates cultripes]|uniref:Uncharacterized protein n=1 Tax=Pelobates cultripes TaxID=61616 RepID=A0AAD1SGB3_PELCU|nr:Hypothetical predicted protein [Pelobates cultripes]
MSSRIPAKKSQKESPSVADMLTSQWPAPRGMPAASSSSRSEQRNLPQANGSEQRMEHVVTAHNTATTLTNSLLHRITNLELELEDVSNRSRRSNLRIRGLPETVEDADLEKALLPTKNCQISQNTSGW